MPSETTEFAADMARIVSASRYANDRSTTAIAAGCLYAAALAVGTGINGDLRFERSFRGSDRASRPTEGTHEGDSQSKSTQTRLCAIADITPVSLRRYTREAAGIYLESAPEMRDPSTRERLARLALR